MTSVLQVRYGRRDLRTSDAYDDFESTGLADEPLEMDYNFWLVRDGHETIVVDTGYDVSSGVWLGEQSVLPVPDALASLGIDPAEVSTVVLTHFHFDHIGHVALFPNATLWCARAEWEYWIGKLERGELDHEFTDAALLAPVIRAHDDRRVRFVDESAHVHPDVTAIVVGGHCPGQLVVAVRSGASGVLLAADAAHYHEQVERGLPFFTYTDRGDMIRALRTLRQTTAMTGWRLVPGHDPVVRATYPALPGHPEVTVLLDDASHEDAAQLAASRRKDNA